MRIAITTDWHFTARQPKNRNTPLLPALLRKMSGFCEFMKKNNIKVWLDNGDFFDSPSQSCALLNELLEVIDLPDGLRGEFILGNHLIKGNAEVSMKKSAIPALERLGMITVHEDPFIWKCPATGTTVLLWHHTIVPEPVPWEHMLYQEVAEKFDVDFVVVGHIHTPRKAMRVGKTVFLAPGSMARGMGREDNPIREPKFVVLDTLTKKFKYVSIECEENPFKEKAVSNDLEARTEELIGQIKEIFEAGVNLRSDFPGTVRRLQNESQLSDAAAEYLLKKLDYIREDS